jgi:hypothetical protein
VLDYPSARVSHDSSPYVAYPPLLKLDILISVRLRWSHYAPDIYARRDASRYQGPDAPAGRGVWDLLDSEQHLPPLLARVLLIFFLEPLSLSFFIGPGTKILDAAGGSHRFQGWSHNLLTDSGGFQLVSLNKFTKITEEGALFASPFDGKPTLLTVRAAILPRGPRLTTYSPRRACVSSILLVQISSCSWTT